MNLSASEKAANAAIPFQDTNSVGLDTLVIALAVTVLLLAVFALVAFFGKRKGWWGLPASSNDSSTRTVVEEVINLSRATQMIVVRRGETRWVVFESSKQLAVHREDRGGPELKE
jgi:hypothetical protein